MDGRDPACGRDIRMFAAARTIYVDLWSELVLASSRAGLSIDQFRAAINPDTIVDFTAGLLRRGGSPT